jgi:hypothetical protein
MLTTLKDEKQTKIWTSGMLLRVATQFYHKVSVARRIIRLGSRGYERLIGTAIRTEGWTGQQACAGNLSSELLHNP